ncbi:MAG: fumarylacetoacetate hydrolase family protein [Gammaproteobacteria bacterium]|nr:fumarylacetoacetate hydrolase family protein [Gammaproteobacteria bacterium]
MKLATLKVASPARHRDGRLVIVASDLLRAVDASDIAPTLQWAIDHWDTVAAALATRSRDLNAGALRQSFAFDATEAASPLPRAYQWADGSAYVNHVELVRRARGAQMPQSFWTDPLIYQGGSDDFLGPRDAIPVEDLAWGADFEGEVAVITDDVPAGTPRAQAAAHIKLLMLVNDVSLRGLIPGELDKGFGFYQSKPASSFSPVAVTPDELGDAWDGGRVHLPLLVHLNGQLFGRPDAGTDMVFDFCDLIAHAARTRRLGAGTIIGSGTVSNKQDTAHGSAIADGGVGYSCLAELRMIQTIHTGKPATPFLTYGDRVRLEMLDARGRSVFGAIEQTVVKP